MTAEPWVSVDQIAEHLGVTRDPLLSFPQFPSSGGVPEGRGGSTKPPRQAAPATPPREGNL
jgi:hypothetical protein